jgi:hypothetical protein
MGILFRHVARPYRPQPTCIAGALCAGVRLCFGDTRGQGRGSDAGMVHQDLHGCRTAVARSALTGASMQTLSQASGAQLPCHQISSGLADSSMCEAGDYTDCAEQCKGPMRAALKRPSVRSRTCSGGHPWQRRVNARQEQRAKPGNPRHRPTLPRPGRAMSRPPGRQPCSPPPEPAPRSRSRCGSGLSPAVPPPCQSGGTPCSWRCR